MLRYAISPPLPFRPILNPSYVHTSACCISLDMLSMLDLQGGTLYGLWGTLLVAYGIVFSTAIDLLGEPPASQGLAASPCEVAASFTTGQDLFANELVMQE